MYAGGMLYFSSGSVMRGLRAGVCAEAVVSETKPMVDNTLMRVASCFVMAGDCSKRYRVEWWMGYGLGGGVGRGLGVGSNLGVGVGLGVVVAVGVTVGVTVAVAVAVAVGVCVTVGVAVAVA